MSAAAGGIPRVIMAGIPAMTLQEVRLGVTDKNAGRHWSRGRCWCGGGHGSGAGTAELPLVAPPWDAARSGEGTR